jgi:hypothetical protein
MAHSVKKRREKGERKKGRPGSRIEHNKVRARVREPD